MEPPADPLCAASRLPPLLFLMLPLPPAPGPSTRGNLSSKEVSVRPSPATCQAPEGPRERLPRSPAAPPRRQKA